MGTGLIVYVFGILDVVDPGRKCSLRLGLDERCAFAMLSWKGAHCKGRWEKTKILMTLPWW